MARTAAKNAVGMGSIPIRQTKKTKQPLGKREDQATPWRPFKTRQPPGRNIRAIGNPLGSALNKLL